MSVNNTKLKLNSHKLFFQPVNESSAELPLTIYYQPISFGKLRLWVSMETSLTSLLQLGKWKTMAIIFCYDRHSHFVKWLWYIKNYVCAMFKVLRLMGFVFT